MDWGYRDGTVVRALASLHCGPGSIPGPGVTCGLSLLFVLVPTPRVFLLVFWFSSLHKNPHSKFQFNPEMRATGLSALLLSVTPTKQCWLLLLLSGGPVQSIEGAMVGVLGCLSPAGCINGCRRIVSMCTWWADIPSRGVEMFLVALTLDCKTVVFSFLFGRSHAQPPSQFQHSLP